ncbi:MAG: hypothetical protein JSU68_11150 [Phycisphaerales bacterium]|nr:MAG: hypothetical protein JSU68_11150 [Phycisphaerales bacterium]
MIDRCNRDYLPYPDDAFHFVEQGLPYTVRREHGEPSPDLRRLEAWLQEQDIGYEALAELYESGELPGPLQELIQELGGPEGLNRHVSGQELCWGLRDLAVKRWGLLAKTVLRQWKVKRTEDFGKIVFALIDEGKLRRQAGDSIDDFKNVFDFDEAFDLADLSDTPTSND